MPRDVNTMSDHELLAELVLLQRRSARLSRLRLIAGCILLLALVVLALIYIPRIMEPIHQLSASMDQIQDAAANAQEFFSSLDAGTAERLADALDGLAGASEEIGAFVDGLRNSGLDQTQKAIDELNEMLGKLTDFFRWG